MQLPPLDNPEDMANWLIGTFDGVMDAEMFFRVTSRVGRNGGPYLLHMLYIEGVISVGVVAEVIGEVWTMAEHPDHFLDRSEWLELFEAVGYTEEGRQAQRPSEPVRLYRGAVPEHSACWSWTTDLEVAQRFARDFDDGGYVGRMAGKVYVTDAPPEALLCRTGGREDGEYVTDTSKCQIREMTCTPHSPEQIY